MIFRQLVDDTSKTYTYLIADEKTRRAVLVDPVLEQYERDIKLLKELNLSLDYVLETHIHADHITSAHLMRVKFGCQILLPAGSNVPAADGELKDGDDIVLGKTVIKTIATPGHVPSHNAYYVGNKILTGDSLFIRGCARTDFQGGDAATLYDSITQKIFTLPDDVLVHPGHDYNGNLYTSIAEEKQWNPRLNVGSKEKFIELMANLNLPDPMKLKEAIPANLQLGDLSKL